MSNNKNTILLVEDEDSLSNLYKTVLSTKFNLKAAKNYEDALEFLNTDHIDLILLDVIIPANECSNLDYDQKIGFNILKKFSKIPTIVFTNLDSPADRQIAKELNAVDYIVKANILPKEIIKKINSVLNV